MLVGLFALIALGADGQQPDTGRVAPTPVLGERLQVTSVDLWIGVDRGPLGTRPRLQRDELELRLAGERAEIAALDQAAIGGAPRRVVVFIDAVLGDQTSVRWSASRLAERAGDLVAIGDVEVVIADPDPRVIVAATRDVERLHDGLSGLALFAGGEAAIPLLRDEFLDVSEDDGDPELASSFLAEEVSLVLRRQDLLLRRLIDGAPVDGAERGSTSGPGGVLLYVSQGFDLDPVRFYLGDSDEERELQRETTSWVRTLAAYGWTCAPLVYEDRRALLRRGLRIGKWRFGGPRKSGGPLVLLSGSYEGERDADKAAALVELADTLLRAGDYEQASDTYLRAIHHFYGDPRTQSRQAYAWRQLALALKRSGEVDQARRAFANALELDPELDAEVPPEAMALTIGVDGLDQMAGETGGHLLRGSEGLLPALEEIARRQRLSFTLRGAPSGSLLPVEVSAKSRTSPLRFSRWTRSGAPERIAIARLRLFLQTAAGEPTAEGSASLHLTADSSGRSMATLSLPAFDDDKAHRVLVGTIGEQRPPQVVTLVPDANHGSPASWRGEMETADDTVVAAVYTEDLGSGEWDVAPVAVVFRVSSEVPGQKSP